MVNDVPKASREYNVLTRTHWVARYRSMVHSTVVLSFQKQCMQYFWCAIAPHGTTFKSHRNAQRVLMRFQCELTLRTRANGCKNKQKTVFRSLFTLALLSRYQSVIKSLSTASDRCIASRFTPKCQITPSYHR